MVGFRNLQFLEGGNGSRSYCLQKQDWLPNVTPAPVPVSVGSSFVPHSALDLARRLAPPFQVYVWLEDLLQPREGLQMERGLAGACGSGWLGWLRPSHDVSLERGSRHRGIQAACVVYKKPSGALSWDCSHLFVLFPCKMLLTVLHQGQFILNGMYRHSIHLYFLPTLLSTPTPCF